MSNLSVKTLIALADMLDEEGMEDEANEIDNLIEEVAAKEELNEQESDKTLENKDIQDSFGKLAAVADDLDKIGAFESAELIDNFLASFGAAKNKEDPYNEKEHKLVQVREPKKKQERVDRDGLEEHHLNTMKEVKEEHLSTRYCPDHIGVQVGRVSDGVFQCPIDGKVYNWVSGWTDQNGKNHPGGSVSAQTPNSADYGYSHRIFDSRDKASKK